jgi:serine/threonine-protein kinase
MPDQTRLDALLLRYEALRGTEPSVDIEELCRDCPELLPELRRQIRNLESMNALLHTVPNLPGHGSAPPAAVDALSRYRVLRLHARGGLGEVYLAHDEQLQRPVAVKRLKPAQATNAASRGRFLREAALTGRLEHPSIVPIHALGQDESGQAFYAMRFVEGETLQDALQRFHAKPRMQQGPEADQRLTLRRLVSRLVTVANTVAYAHSQSVLHRDIKPANILLGPYGETLLVDWGLAKVIGAAGEPESGTAEFAAHADDTRPGDVLGTPAYMSPEQAAGELDWLGPASDVYSLGATLYALLTGQPPYAAGHVGEVLEGVKRGEFPPPRRLNREVPRALEAVSLKAMARRPEDRYAGALELAADLERWLADEPVAAWREPWPTRVGRWLRRHKTLATAAAALLLTALAALAVTTTLVRRQQRETAAQKERAEYERDRAADNLRLAKQAVVEYLGHVAEDPDLRKADFFPLRKRLLAAAVPFWEQFARQQGDEPEARADRGRAYYHLARLRAEVGETAAAISDYESMRDLFTDLVESHPDVASYRKELVRSNNNLAILYQATGRLKEAEESYRLARKHLEGLTQELPEVPEYQRLLGLTHNNLAILYNDQARLSEAETSYLAARKVQLHLVQSHPEVPLFRRDLASTYHDLGSFYRDTSRPQDAEAAYRQARDLQARLAADYPDEAAYRQDRAQTDINLGVLYQSQGRWKEAEACYRLARSTQRELADAFPSLPHYRQGVGQCQHNLASIAFATGRLTEALAAEMEAVATRQALARKYPAVVEYQSELGQSWHNLGVFQKAARRLSDAENCLARALEIQQGLVRDQPTLPRYRQERSLTYYTLAELRRDQGKVSEAPPLLGKAIRDLDAVLEREPRNSSARLYLANAHVVRADACTRLGRHRAALPDWDRALALTAGSNRDQIRLQRAVTLVHLGQRSKAFAEVEAVLEKTPVSGVFLYKAATVLAVASGAVARDAGLSEVERNKDATAYGLRAVHLLKEAHAARLFKSQTARELLQKDAQLNSLRDRKDFKKLLAEVQKAAGES